jgi:hypothetical protein
VSEHTIFGYRFDGREGAGRASQIEIEAAHRGEQAHCIVVSRYEIECWIREPSDEVVTNPPEVKGLVFTGLVTREHSKALRAAAGERAMERNRRARRGSIRGGLDPAAMHIDDWWSNTAGVG